MRFVPDLLGVMGLAAETVGCWMIYIPAALIVAGTLLLVIGYRMQWHNEQAPTED